MVDNIPDLPDHTWCSHIEASAHDAATANVESRILDLLQGIQAVVVAAGAFAYLSFVESTVFKTTMAFVGSATATGGVLAVPHVASRLTGRFDSLGRGRG
mgnify:CR=1 FL=1